MRQVHAYGMPRLAQGERDGTVVPVELHKSLAQTQDGNHRTGAEVIEVGLHFTGNAHFAPLVPGHIQAQTGGEGHETPVETGILVIAVLHTHILGHIVIKVLRTGIHGTGIGGYVVTDKAVQLEVGRLFFLRKSSAPDQERCQNNDMFLHIMQTGTV